MGSQLFSSDLLTRHEPADCSTSPGSDLARASSEPALSPAGRRRGCTRQAVRLTGCRISAPPDCVSIRPPKSHDVADGRSHHRAVAEVPPLRGERVGVREDRDGGSRSSVAATSSRFTVSRPFFFDLLTRHEPADCSTSPGSDLARASSEPALSSAGRRRGCPRRAVRLTGCRISAPPACVSIVRQIANRKSEIKNGPSNGPNR